MKIYLCVAHDPYSDDDYAAYEELGAAVAWCGERALAYVGRRTFEVPSWNWTKHYKYCLESEAGERIFVQEIEFFPERKP